MCSMAILCRTVRFTGIVIILLVVFGSVVHAFPIQIGDQEVEDLTRGNRTVPDAKDVWTAIATAAAVLTLLSAIYILGCACCRFRPRLFGFKKFRDDNVLVHEQEAGFEHDGVGSAGEVHLVPAQLESIAANKPLPVPTALSSVVEGRPADSYIPAALATWSINGCEKDWFDDPHGNFPRNQLKYVELLGKGWFGQAILTEAWGRGISSERQKRAVVVKSLTEGASPAEQMCFLHEVRAFRDVNHPNVLRLVGRCLEADPFLVILEYCCMGDLKAYLRSQRGTPGEEGLKRDGVLLRMAQEVAAALSAMHHQGIVHLDLAARNCLVADDMRIKVGDYGCAMQKYPEDYLLTDNGAVPIRWVAPECVRPALSSVEIKELTKEANIWAYGVVLWEILEMGARPYGELVVDSDVIKRVIVERNYRLRLPTGSCPYKDRLYQVMHMCWQEEQLRPTMTVVNNLMNHLLHACDSYSSPDDVGADFEIRWHALQQSNKPAVLNLDSSYDLHPSLCFESDFNLTAMKDQMLGGRSHGSFLADVEEEEHFSPGGAFALGPQEERRISSGEEDFKRWLDGETSVMNVNFKIGKDDQSIVSRVPFSPQSMSASLLDGTLESLRLPSAPNSHNNANSNDTDTDDDVAWKFKLENEYLTKKVREKSKSVQDLMKLTHLDSSPDPDSSDSDSPPVKSGSNLNSLTNFCASESDIRGAVVEKAFLEDLEKLQAERHVQLASTVKPEEDPRRKEQCRPVSTSTPRPQYPALETISADLAKFRPEVYDLDASDVIMGPCDDLGLNCFQALKSTSIIGGKPSATVSTMTSAAKRSLFTQHQDSSTTSGYGSCHDADSGKETTPDAPDVVFWSNNAEKGDKTDDSADNNCGSSVSSQDSGVGDKMRAPKAMTMAPVSQSMDSVLDLFTDLEEAAGVSEGQEKGLSPKGRKKRKKHSSRWSTESSGSYVVVKTPPKDLDDTVDEADEASTSTNDEDELEVSTKKRRSKRWSTETTGSIVVINTPERDEDVCNLSRISEELDVCSNRWSTETADSVVFVNTPVRTVPTAPSSANTSKMSEGSSASTLYVTAREDLSNESYATIVAIEDEATLTPGQFDRGLHRSEDAMENCLKVEDLFNTSISPIDSQPSSFGPLDYLSAEGRGSIDKERTPVSTRSEPGFGDELLSHLGKRRASEPVGFSFGDPIDDEQDDEDRENKTESLKDLRAMLCLTLGGGDPQSESVDPAKLEESVEEAEEVENVVINHCSGSGTGSGSLSSSLPLVLSPIHELSETEEGEESNSSDEESSDESEVEREDLQKPNFHIPTINHGAIVVEDLDSPDRFDSIRTLENQHSSFIEGFMGDEDEDDEFSDRDDILVVDTETNQAFLCNGAKPKAQLAFVCQERPLLEPEELEVYGQNDEEDPESLPVFDVGGKVGSSSKYFGGPRALKYPAGGMLHSLPPVGFGDNDEDEVWLKHGRESGLLQPMSLPWGGEKPEEQFLYQEDPWTRDRAVASMSSLRNAAGSVSNDDSPARSVGNEEDRNSSVFSSPRDIPLPDDSDRCRENAEEQGGEIEPQWSQLVEEAENSEQINFNTLTDLGPSLNDDDVADLPCLTYTDADIDGEDAVGDLVDTADGQPEGSELGACAAVAGSEVEGVRYTPDFEGESTEESEESDDDDASTTSGEYVYTRSPVEQKSVEPNENDEEPEATNAASAMAGRLMALNPKERPMEGDEGSDAENGDHEEEERPQANGQYPFQPSIWNRELAPSRSLLKTPDKPPTPDAKKSVTFKKPKCSKIYEYPGPEPESHLKNAYRGFAISDDYTHKLWSLSSNSRPVNVAEWDAADDDDIPEELTSGPSTWPSVGAAFHVDDEEIYPTPSRLSTMNYFSFRPERTEGDGGFSGSEFFPGRYTSVEFFDENQTSPEKPGPTKRQPSSVHSNFRAEGEPCSLPNTSDLHSMWRKEGRLPDRSDLRLELRPAPLGAESCEPPADAKPSETDKDIGGDSDEGICDTGIAKGEALALE